MHEKQIPLKLEMTPNRAISQTQEVLTKAKLSVEQIIKFIMTSTEYINKAKENKGRNGNRD